MLDENINPAWLLEDPELACPVGSCREDTDKEDQVSHETGIIFVSKNCPENAQIRHTYTISYFDT